jgi:hypothetical protein
MTSLFSDLTGGAEDTGEELPFVEEVRARPSLLSARREGRGFWRAAALPGLLFFAAPSRAAARCLARESSIALGRSVVETSGARLLSEVATDGGATATDLGLSEVSVFGLDSPSTLEAMGGAVETTVVARAFDRSGSETCDAVGGV